MLNKFVLVVGWFSLSCLPLHAGTFHVSVETGDDGNPVAMRIHWTLISGRPLLPVILAAIVFRADTWVNATAADVGSLSAAETQYDVVVYGSSGTSLRNEGRGGD